MASSMNDHNNQRMDNVTNPVNPAGTAYTSETLRLEPRESERTNLHLQGYKQSSQVKKTSSFQITSVTSRVPDGGEGDDSAEDTEETSDMLDQDCSKVTATDVEQDTPSFSEDYSKSEEVFVGAAPVIPTSSQYGITALVQQAGSGGMMTARLPQGVTVDLTEGGIALAKTDGEPDDVDDWQNRFKIVKINSNEPFKRGRWFCLDFMDSPAGSASFETKSEEVPNMVVNSHKEVEDQPQTVIQMPPHSQHPVPSQTHTVPAQFSGQVYSTSVSASMAPSLPVGTDTVSMQPISQQAQSGVQYPSQAAQQPQVPSIPKGYSSTSQPPQGAVHPSPSAQTPPQAQPATTQTSVPVAQQPGMQGVPQGAMPVGIPGGRVPQPSHVQPPQSIAITQQGGMLSQPITSQGIAQTMVAGMPSQAGGQTQQISQQSSVTAQQGQQQPVAPQQQGMPTAAVTSQAVTQGVPPTQQVPMQSVVNPKNIASHPSSSATTPAQPPGHPNLAAAQMSLQSDQHPLAQPPTQAQHPIALEGLPINQAMEEPSGATATPPAPMVTQSEDTESASAASTVAIDNKIEQAMDLVKSHLMFAVREEVDVLKDRIGELLERISQLECENSVLRQYATQEALQQLQQAHHSSNT